MVLRLILIRQCYSLSESYQVQIRCVAENGEQLANVRRFWPQRSSSCSYETAHQHFFMLVLLYDLLRILLDRDAQEVLKAHSLSLCLGSNLCIILYWMVVGHIYNNVRVFTLTQRSFSAWSVKQWNLWRMWLMNTVIVVVLNQVSVIRNYFTAVYVPVGLL